MRSEKKSGDSIEEAIVIIAGDETEGIAAEYELIAERWGVQGQDWEMMEQSFDDRGVRKYDRIDIRLKGSTMRTVYFEISSFYGKYE